MLVERTERKRIFGRHRYRWMDDIKTNLEEIELEDVNWIYLSIYIFVYIYIYILQGVRDLHVAFNIRYVYDFVTKLCRSKQKSYRVIIIQMLAI
jgi:hypothetical protein